MGGGDEGLISLLRQAQGRSVGLARGGDGWRAGRNRGAGWLGRGGASGRGEQAAQGLEGTRQVGWEERGEDQGEGGEEEREEVEGGGHFKRGCGGLPG